MKIFLWIIIAIAAIIVLFAAILLINAARAKHRARKLTGKRKAATGDSLKRYCDVLSKMIKCRTVSDGQHSAEFEKFRSVLREAFPLLHEKAEISVFGDGCLVYKISGKNAAKNVMLMSHHDVAEANETEWKHPPFCGEVHGDALWGRGTVDTKTPLFAILQATEELLDGGCEFEGVNLYIGSSHNEEICGDGMLLAAQHFKESGIRFDVVSDEGGAITSKMMPGVKAKSAMIAVHEKGRHCFTCTAEALDKGHLGLKTVKVNAVERMSAFISEVKSSKILRSDFASEVRATFATHAPYMSFPMRLLFANTALLKRPLLRLLPKVSEQAEGMLKTTLHFTRINGGDSEQIQAKTVAATAFFRCVRSEQLTRELDEFKKIADKYSITVTPTVQDYCKPSSFDTPQYRTLEKVLNQNFPDVIVSPFLLTAGTDARRFSDIADCILRFAPIDLSPEQFRSVHSADENIGVQNIGECVLFYKDYIRALSE